MVDQSRDQPLLATERKLSLSFDPVVSASTGFNFINLSRREGVTQDAKMSLFIMYYFPFGYLNESLHLQALSYPYKISI